MIETDVVKHIENQLRRVGRYWTNVHGSRYSQNGTPDVITFDKDGMYVGLEVKVPKRNPVVNQWRHAIRILKAGGRFVVGYDDFDVTKLDSHSLPITFIGDEEGESEFEAARSIKLTCTTEIKLKQ